MRSSLGAVARANGPVNTDSILPANSSLFKEHLNMATTFMPRTVSDNVANFFKSQGLMSPIRNNYRRISTAAISRPPSRSTALSLSPGQPISHRHFDASFVGEEASEVEIPAVLHSIETYMYMGF